jgi:hypothetical protein
MISIIEAKIIFTNEHDHVDDEGGLIIIIIIIKGG